ncbi:MAG: hypothetical protein Q7S82_03285 [bacterium]|nr:hypothetical protein [bacterium]
MDTEKNNQEEIDLSGALKDSGVKSQDEQRKPARIFRPETSKIVQWVIRYSGGLVKNERQASYVLFGIAALAIIISIFLIFGKGGVVETKKTFAPPAEAPAEEVIPPAL